MSTSMTTANPIATAQRLVTIKYTTTIALAMVACALIQPPILVAVALVAVGFVRSLMVIAAINAAQDAGVFSEQQTRLVKRFANPLALIGDAAASAVGTYAGALIAVVAAERLYGPWSLTVLAVLVVAVLARNASRGEGPRRVRLTVDPFADPVFWAARAMLTGFLAFQAGLFGAWAVCAAYGLVVRAIYRLCNERINDGFDALRVELTAKR